MNVRSFPLEMNFLADGGEAGALMRGLDWEATPLGAPETWPQSLRTVVSLLLTSKFPMFLAWGPDLAFLYNDGYTPILGGRHPAAMGQPFREVWPEIWDDLTPLVNAALAGEATYRENLPLVMLRKGFEEKAYFTFSYSPVRDETGGIAGLFCACSETTEEVKARASLREEHERLRELFQQAPGFMAVVRGPDHVFEITNASYQELVGFRDLIGKPVREALPEVEGQGFFELLDRSYRTGEPYVAQSLPLVVQRRAGGAHEQRFVDFVYQPIRDGDGIVTGIFIEGNDVTEQVRSVKAVRESEDHYRHTVELNPQVAWTAAPDGQLDGVAPRWEEWTGASGLGDSWGDAIHPDDLYHSSEAWARACRTGKPYDVEHRVRLRSGQYHWMRSRAFPRRDGAGRIIRWYGTTEDIHDRRQAQEHQLLMINELNHRVKNTLATVQSIASQTLRNARTLDEARVSFEGRLLALSRAHDVLTRENWEGADLRDIVGVAVAPYAAGEGRFRLEGPRVVLQPRQALAIAMALQELATNAAKYGALATETGEVRLTWSREAFPPHLHLRWEETGGPPVSPPARRGFGSRLIERSLAHDLGGTVAIEFAPGGVVCVVDAPLTHQG
jgi:PAS domain S-box-containing protein